MPKYLYSKRLFSPSSLIPVLRRQRHVYLCEFEVTWSAGGFWESQGCYTKKTFLKKQKWENKTNKQKILFSLVYLVTHSHRFDQLWLCIQYHALRREISLIKAESSTNLWVINILMSNEMILILLSPPYTLNNPSYGSRNDEKCIREANYFRK